MTIVLQRTYRPTLAPAVAGFPADQGVGRDDITRLCETAAGIGFGLAVSQGSGDKGCILGGSAFIGIALRDPTLSLVPIDMTLADSVQNPLDKYGQYTNVWVRTLGRVWVQAGANVVAGNALFYNSTTGAFSNSASGVSGQGYVDFTQQPVDGQTIVLNGSTFTAKASGATGAQFNIGPTLGDTITNLVAVLNASGDANITPATYAAWPPTPGGGSGAYRLMISYDTVGTGGNSYTIATGTWPGSTRSAATLAGGAAGGTAISGGSWVTSSLGGDLAVVNLGIKVA